MHVPTADIAHARPRGATEKLVPVSDEVRHSSAYRPDIDGLRAIAVVPVVLFHAGLQSFSGGFVGVDIFFVISGYLITGVLYRECVANKLSIARFYERRIRRIFPALFVTLFAVFVAGLFLYVPVELATLGKRIATTTLFLSNVYFWRHSGYFDEAASGNPLLHTWSLAIEEQFYIIFPLALWLLIRWRVKLLPALIAVAVVSFGLSVVGVAKFPSAAFYLLPSRAWELMLGGILALVPTYHGRFAGLLAATGVVAILAAVFSYSPATPFPGVAALLPCLGAAAIVGVTGEQSVGRMLSTIPFRGVGLISYSLYLWHLPLFVFVALVVGRPLPTGILWAAVAASFAIAVASWYFVEQPVRSWRSRRQLWLLGVFCIAAGLSVSAIAVIGHGLPGRYSADGNALLRDSKDELAVHRAAYKCGHNRFGKDLGPCPIGVSGSPELVVIGDSHVMAMRDVLDRVATQKKIPAVLLSAKGCPPVLGFHRPGRDCITAEHRIFDYVKATKPRAVLFIARWGNPLFGEQTIVDGKIGKDDASRFSNVKRALDGTVASYRQLGVNVGIILPAPGAREDVARNLARGVGAPLTFTEREHRARFARFKAAVEALHPAAVGDFADVFCHGVCKVTENRQPLYMDDNHVNKAGQNVAEPVISDVVERLLAPAQPIGGAER